MAFRQEQPISRFGAVPPSVRFSLTEKAEEADERARRRFLIAKTVAKTGGSLTMKRQMIKAAMQAELLPPGPLPARETIRRLEQRWRVGHQSVEDYLDAPRSGRPVELLDAQVEDAIRDLIKGGSDRSALSLACELKEAGQPRTSAAPSYYQVHKRFANAGRFVRSASRHGSLAAVIDSVPHTRVPTRHTHDVWALDELTTPVWLRMWDRRWSRWVSFHADVVLVIDVCSGVLMGYQLANPARRFDTDGVQFRSGFDADDVLAALLSAACPELAPDSTREIAGYLPGRLRWDNHQAHKSLAEQLESGALIDVNLRRIPKRRAISNGAAERRVQIAKKWCAGMFGHVDDYLPTDQVWNEASADPGAERTRKAGGTSDRQPRLTPVLPEQLMTLEEFRVEFDRIVKRYNYEHVSRRRRARSLDLYHENLPARLPRRGRDLVRALPMATTLVSREGIVHHAHGRSFAYSSVVENMLLLLDTPVAYHADPLGRGVFLRFADKLYFQRPQMEWAALDGTKLARSQAAAARLVSNHTESIRQRKMAERLGEDGVAEAKKGHEAAVSRFKAWQAGETDLPPLYTPAHVPDPEADCLFLTVQDADDRAGGADPAPIADHAEASQSGPPSPAYRPLTPWLNDDPSAFLRRAEGNTTTPSADPADGPTAASDDADRPNPEQ